MDLWSEFDNNLQLPPEPVVKARTRRLTERAIQSLVREWLLVDYVPAYARSLAATHIFRRCYWIDALGLDARSARVVETPETNGSATGKGRRKVAGSVAPALQPLLDLASVLSQEKKPIALQALFFEAGSSRKRGRNQEDRQVTGSAKELPMPSESGIVRASWLEAASVVLPGIEQVPAVFLLNPFGPVLFSVEEMIQLYQRTVPSELCLFVPHKQLEQHLRAALRSPDLGSRLTGLLRSDRWKTLLVSDQEISGSLEKLLLLFTDAMQKHFQLPVQRIILPLQVWPAYVEAVPYTLIFATRRQDSLLCMNDAVYLLRHRLYEQSQQGILGEEWFVQQARQKHEEERNQLYQRVLQQGRAQKSRRWPDLRQQLLMASFGQFSRQEYDRTLVQLLSDGEVRCEWRQRPVESEILPVPGENDTLIWFNKRK